VPLRAERPAHEPKAATCEPFDWPSQMPQPPTFSIADHEALSPNCPTFQQINWQFGDVKRLRGQQTDCKAMLKAMVLKQRMHAHANRGAHGFCSPSKALTGGRC